MVESELNSFGRVFFISRGTRDWKPVVFHLASAGDTQCTNELLKVDSTGLVAVEHIEHIVGERARISEREELSVDLLKLFLGECTRRAVLEETLVPLLQLLLVKMGGLLKLNKLILRELGL
jgi:hypothetical protein